MEKVLENLEFNHTLRIKLFLDFEYVLYGFVFTVVITITLVLLENKRYFVSQFVKTKR